MSVDRVNTSSDYVATNTSVDVKDLRLDSDVLRAGVQGESSSSAPVVTNLVDLSKSLILPRTSLGALGLSKPGNQGDGEVLVAQVFSAAESLREEGDSEQEAALSAAAAAQARILVEAQARVSALRVLNDEARETITQNTAILTTLGFQIEDVTVTLQDLEGLSGELQDEIRKLEGIEPPTNEIEAQLDSLRVELQAVNSRIESLSDVLSGLQTEINELNDENLRLNSEIAQRVDAISAQNQLVSLTTRALDRLVTAAHGFSTSVYESQKQALTEANERVLADILPDMQKIIESSIENDQIKTINADTRTKDHEIEEAVKTGEESANLLLYLLGVFYSVQNSVLVELDGYTTSFGNDKGRRFKIPV